MNIMRVLFCIDSYFQLILAVNLRTTVYKDYVADIIVYNSIPTAESICIKLRKLKSFNHVWLARTSLTRCGKKYSFKEKLPKYGEYLMTIVSPQKRLEKYIGSSFDYKYDELIFNGTGALPECIFNAAYKQNNQLTCKRIEDSYVNYFTEYVSQKGKLRIGFESIIQLLFGRKSMEKYVSAFYFEDADLVSIHVPYSIVQAPKISRENQELVKTLNFLFDYEPDQILKEKEVIMFEDGRHFFSGDDEEVDIVKAILKEIDSSKIAVKMHPRRVKSRFDQFGVYTVKNSTVPWEIIQMNMPCTGKAFLTVSSAVVFSSGMYFNDKCKNILLYKCMKKEYSGLNSNFEQFVAKYKQKYGAKSILVPTSYEELVNVIMNKN